MNGESFSRNQSQSDECMEIATRFIALAPVVNANKRKWLYALNLTPVDRSRLSDLVIKTTDETLSPYPKSMLSDDPKQTQARTQFFYDMDSKDTAKRSRHRKDAANKKARMEFDQSKCWFCLSSPVVSKHLVISVGTEIYLALAKGGLVEDHFLILPITHHQSLSILPQDVKEEMNLYKQAVTKYYETTDRVPVFFERNFKTSHCQLQAVPVHKNQAPALKEMFEVLARSLIRPLVYLICLLSYHNFCSQELAECNNFKMLELPQDTDLQRLAKPGSLYFYAELPDGQLLYYRIKKDFPLQFGREVLASDRILDINDRSDWKDCHMSQDEETELAKKIRKQFAPFDIDD